MLGNSLGYAAAGCLVMAMGGCAVFEGAVSEPRSQQPPAEMPREEQQSGSAGDDQASPAVKALMAQAKAHVEAKEYSQAASVLERALRIEPRNPVLYSQLAGLYLVQEQPDQAESLARKSNSLAGNWPELQARNWRTIAGAMRARGDEASAKAAEQRAELFQSRVRP